MFVYLFIQLHIKGCQYVRAHHKKTNAPDYDVPVDGVWDYPDT
jgi:hypothetical protein